MAPQEAFSRLADLLVTFTSSGVQVVGGTSFAATQVTVTNVATILLASRTARHFAMVTNTGTTIVYIGGSGVLTTTGDYLAGIAGAAKGYETTAALYGIVGSGTQVVTVVEVY